MYKQMDPKIQQAMFGLDRPALHCEGKRWTLYSFMNALREWLSNTQDNELTKDDYGGWIALFLEEISHRVNQWRQLHGIEGREELRPVRRDETHFDVVCVAENCNELLFLASLVVQHDAV